MSIKITDLPTDVYNRFVNLNKELVKASGVADRSKDNLEALMATLDVIAEAHGYNVVRKPQKRVKKEEK